MFRDAAPLPTYDVTAISLVLETPSSTRPAQNAWTVSCDKPNFLAR